MLIVIKAEKFGDYKLNSYLCEVKIKVSSLVVRQHIFHKGTSLDYQEDVFFLLYVKEKSFPKHLVIS